MTLIPDYPDLIPVKKKCISEKEIETDILEYLNSLSNCFAWKENTVGVWDPAKKVYRNPKSRYILKGISDILALYKGKFLAIEVKTPARKKQLSENQRNFLEKINFYGGYGTTCSSVEDVIVFLKELDGRS